MTAHNQRVVAVVPLHKPSSCIVDYTAGLVQKVYAVVLVRDSDIPKPIEDGLLEVGATIVGTGKNLGIATALNTGSAHALGLGASHVLFLDQDSAVEGDYISQALYELSKLESVGFGIIAPEEIGDAKQPFDESVCSTVSETSEVIQSGMLVSARCLEMIGSFDASLFIDAVDSEFCLRAAEGKWKIGVLRGHRIEHQLGRQAKVKFRSARAIAAGRPEYFNYHPPFRVYYIIRNNFELWRRYARRNPRWVRGSLKRVMGLVYQLARSGPNRGKHLIAAFVGVTHGLIRRSGIIPNWLDRAVREN